MAKMTKKDFREIATILHSKKPPISIFADRCLVENLWLDLVADFANLCQDSNPNFDSSRFIRWCETGNDRA